VYRDMLEVMDPIRRGASRGELLVTVASKEQHETISKEAKDLAIEAARPHLGESAGFAFFGQVGYILDGSDTPLTDEEMAKPGTIKRGNGRWIQTIRIQGRH
jgi:hypothetical protein